MTSDTKDSSGNRGFMDARASRLTTRRSATIQRLHLALLIATEYQGVLRRAKIETHDVFEVAALYLGKSYSGCLASLGSPQTSGRWKA